MRRLSATIGRVELKPGSVIKSGVKEEMVLILSGDDLFADLLATGLQSLIRSQEEPVVCRTAAEALEQIAEHRFAAAVVQVSPDTEKFLESYRDIDPLLAVIVASDSASSAVNYLRGGPNALALDYVEIKTPDPDFIAKVADLVQNYFRHLKIGDFAIDRQNRTVHFGGTKIDLSPQEFDILVYLARHANTTDFTSYAELASAIYGRKIPQEEAVQLLRQRMYSLKKKLHEAAETDDKAPVLVSQPPQGFRLIPRRRQPRPPRSAKSGEVPGRELIAAGR